MSAESGSIALQDVGRVFWVEGLECAPLERDPNLACGFLIATVDLQKNGQVLENRLLIKFLTATKTALLAKTPPADSGFPFILRTSSRAAPGAETRTRRASR